jgi:hypothetical protein
MANTYTFKINSVDCYTSVDDLSNVIYNVHFSYIAENEDGVYVSINNVQQLESPSAESFVNFEDVREADVIGWIENSVNVEKLKESLDRMLQEKVAPTKVNLRLKVDPGTATEETNTDQTVVDASEAEQAEGQESAATEETTEETV